MRKTDAQDFKYFGEKYPLSWNFVKRLRSGEELQTADISVEDSIGQNVTNSLIDSGTISVVSPRVFVTFVENGGEKGKRYYVSVIGGTANDRYEQTLELEIR